MSRGVSSSAGEPEERVPPPRILAYASQAVSLVQRCIMYETILVTLDTTAADRVVVEHIKKLARLCGSRVVLLHVADGWAARRFGKEAVTPEIPEDRAYLDSIRREFEVEGIPAETALLYGEPKREILKWVEGRPGGAGAGEGATGCDLIAMGTHGHRLLGDLLWGATASHVQHRVDVPVLLVRTPQKG